MPVLYKPNHQDEAGFFFFNYYFGAQSTVSEFPFQMANQIVPLTEASIKTQVSASDLKGILLLWT